MHHTAVHNTQRAKQSAEQASQVGHIGTPPFPRAQDSHGILGVSYSVLLLLPLLQFAICVPVFCRNWLNEEVAGAGFGELRRSWLRRAPPVVVESDCSQLATGLCLVEN